MWSSLLDIFRPGKQVLDILLLGKQLVLDILHLRNKAVLGIFYLRKKRSSVGYSLPKKKALVLDIFEVTPFNLEKGSFPKERPGQLVLDILQLSICYSSQAQQSLAAAS